MAWAGEGDSRLAVIGHQTAKERRQQRRAVLDDTGDDLFGVEGGSLLAEVDIAVDLAGEPEYGEIGYAVGIRQAP